MADHKLQITYDQKTGSLVVVHRTYVDLAGHRVSHAEAIPLGPEAAAAVKEACAAMLADNADEMTKRATDGTVQHVAAVTRKPTKENVKQLLIARSLGPVQTVSSSEKSATKQP